MIKFLKDFFLTKWLYDSLNISWQYLFGFTIGFLIARSWLTFPLYLAFMGSYLMFVICTLWTRYKKLLHERKIRRIIENIHPGIFKDKK